MHFPGSLQMVLEQELDHMSRITRGTQRSCLTASFKSEMLPLSFMTLAFFESTGLWFYGMSLNCGFSVSL